MIAYDLECAGGHAFEGWFENDRAYKKQKKQGLISCPVCGSTEVNRTPSTFGIARRRPDTDSKVAEGVHPLRIISEYVEKNFDDVGADFAKEALKMHYGATESRNIRGVSTQKEEETLREEGVDFFKFPIITDSPPTDEE